MPLDNVLLILKKPGKTSPALGSLPCGKPIILYHGLRGNSSARIDRANSETANLFGELRESHSRLLASSTDDEDLRPAVLLTAQKPLVDSFAVVAGGLHAKGRLSFETGVFGAIEPPKAARRALWGKRKYVFLGDAENLVQLE